MVKGIPAARSPRVPAAVNVTVQVPRDAGLARLLTGTGGHFEQQVTAMAAAASPASAGHHAVTFPAAYAGAVAEQLAALLARARAAGDPAADALASLAGQLGVREPAPEPAAASGPRRLRDQLDGGA